MRLIGLLVTLAVVGYGISVYLGSNTMPEEMRAKPAEYLDQAQQSADAISEAMKKQQEQMERENR